MAGMADYAVTARHVYGRTFTIAIWILGVFAASQIFAVGWALIKRPLQAQARAQAYASATTLPVEAGGPTPASAEPAPVKSAEPATMAPEPAPAPVVVPPLETALPGSPMTPLPPAPAAAPAPAANALPQPSQEAMAASPALQIPDSAVAALVASAVERRASGDMQGALESLRRAEANLPDHPRVLAEVATTYDQMGLNQKALPYWEDVYAMGPDTAGPFFELANFALGGPPDTGFSSAEPPVIRIVSHEAIPNPDVTEGERVTLRVSIAATGDELPVGEDMAMSVYFYDSVDGKEYAPTTADTSEQYVSAPYDWKDGAQEIIEVTYYQPEFTTEQQRDLGERKFYGYIIELFYRDSLQDVVAQPRDLRHEGLRSLPGTVEPVEGVQNSLFPQ